MKNVTVNPIETYLNKVIPNMDRYLSIIHFNVPILGYKLNKDILKHSYWTVDTSSFDTSVMNEFANGNIILVHKIHNNVSLIMSTSQFERYMNHPATKVVSNFDEWSNIERNIAEEYFTRSSMVEEKGMIAPGYIYSTGVADGSANYIVTKVTKASVFLDHLYFGDGYIDPHVSAFGHKIPLKYFEKISGFSSPKLAFRKTPWN